MRRLTSSQAAEQLGVSRQTIINYEKRGLLKGIANISSKRDQHYYRSKDVEKLKPFIEEIEDNEWIMRQYRAAIIKEQKNLQDEYDIRVESTKAIHYLYESMPDFFMRFLRLGNYELNERAKMVFELMIQGLSVDEIARETGVTRECVRLTIKKILVIVSERSLESICSSAESALDNNERLLERAEKAEREVAYLKTMIREEELKNRFSADGYDAELTRFLYTKIRDAGLSVRSMNIAKNAGAIIVADLLSMDEKRVARTRNCGAKSLGEIKRLMKEHGLELGTSPIRFGFIPDGMNHYSPSPELLELLS